MSLNPASAGLREGLAFAGTAAFELVGGEYTHVVADALGGNDGRHGCGGGEDQGQQDHGA